jgi:hypothetical protein
MASASPSLQFIESLVLREFAMGIGPAILKITTGFS